mmetsp:Transcript_55162/g.118491  ORF Transcript_55162/g.118491 Transcript_55162/m.118491 type:complete len:134 (-) Transcript_55162:94-495(-)
MAQSLGMIACLCLFATGSALKTAEPTATIEMDNHAACMQASPEYMKKFLAALKASPIAEEWTNAEVKPGKCGDMGYQSEGFSDGCGQAEAHVAVDPLKAAGTLNEMAILANSLKKDGPINLLTGLMKVCSVTL